MSKKDKKQVEKLQAEMQPHYDKVQEQRKEIIGSILTEVVENGASDEIRAKLLNFVNLVEYQAILAMQEELN